MKELSTYEQWLIDNQLKSRHADREFEQACYHRAKQQAYWTFSIVLGTVAATAAIMTILFKFM